MREFLTDNGEKSMRRLVALWGLILLTILVGAVLFGIVIDTQIIVVVGSMVTVAIGAAAIKNKRVFDGAKNN